MTTRFGAEPAHLGRVVLHQLAGLRELPGHHQREAAAPLLAAHGGPRLAGLREQPGERLRDAVAHREHGRDAPHEVDGVGARPPGRCPRASRRGCWSTRGARRCPRPRRCGRTCTRPPRAPRAPSPFSSAGSAAYASRRPASQRSCMVSWRSISTSWRTLTPWGQCWVQESQPRQRQMLGVADEAVDEPHLRHAHHAGRRDGHGAGVRAARAAALALVAEVRVLAPDRPQARGEGPVRRHAHAPP